MKGLLLALVCGAWAAGTSAYPVDQEETSVLIVGNSLTYYSNTPRILKELAEQSGRRVRIYSLTHPGALLEERLYDYSIHAAQLLYNPKYVVLQERGGVLLCRSAMALCLRSVEAHYILSSQLKDIGATVILMGSYQLTPGFTERLIANEKMLAENLGVELVEVASILDSGQECAADFNWLADDGAHPGFGLSLANAVGLYWHMFGEYPAYRRYIFSIEPSTDRPVDPVLREHFSKLGLGDTSRSISASEMKRIVRLREDGCE